MHSLNLYLLTRYKGNDIDVVERTMSRRNEPLKIKRYEFDTVCSFVEAVLNKDSTIDLLDGFFYSFIIDHIGKEFDLLKFGDGKTVLNTATTRESLLMGPYGGVKLKTIWDGDRLLTIIIEGGH